jgi:small redox-active disulfide protein 2
MIFYRGLFIMEIKILGSGCSNCKKLEENARQAVKDLSLDIDVNKVEDIKQVMKYGVMRLPALVINEKVKSYGKVNTVDEIKKFIQSEQ